MKRYQHIQLLEHYVNTPVQQVLIVEPAGGVQSKGLQRFAASIQKRRKQHLLPVFKQYYEVLISTDDKDEFVQSFRGKYPDTPIHVRERLFRNNRIYRCRLYMRPSPASN